MPSCRQSSGSVTPSKGASCARCACGARKEEWPCPTVQRALAERPKAGTKLLECDSACFAAANLTGSAYEVRDLVAHAGAGAIAAPAKAVIRASPPDG